MRIANPIYDVVFRFMMEDNKVAKAFLSAIIGEEVLELNFSAREHTIHIPPNAERKEEPLINDTVCRFDFTAQIALPDGKQKTVLIELQKAKFASDIMRFRRYLGVHYQDANNEYKSADGRRKARQIYCIFLLGHDIGIPGCPVIEVDAKAKDVTTKEQLDAANEFIESLHHRSWIVQILQLKQRRRTDLEILLSIFDQNNRTKMNHYFLNINEDDFPEIYRPVIRRLRMASENEDMQYQMEMEDDYLEELRERERTAAQKDQVIKEQNKEIKAQGKAIKAQGKVIEEKDKVIEEKGKVLEAQGKALEEKDKALEDLKRQLAEIRKK
jgi:hypothetical protein